MNPPLEYKRVFFGRTRTTQVKCPKCNLWQFKAEECDVCGLLFKEYTKKRPTEYRSEPPSWRDYIPLKVREFVLQRDEYICQYCGIHCYESYIQDRKAVVLDHITPWCGGGRSDPENLITSCRECNAIKHDKVFESMEEARDFILKLKHDSSSIS